jgi:hypothetical protein
MKVTVVYESMFGSTHAVTEAIAAGAREADPGAEVQMLAVRDATRATLAGTGLLIAGGPTHAHGMSTPLTRKQGLEEDAHPAAGGGEPRPLEPGTAGPGIREWLAAAPPAPPGALGAAFDTRDGYRLAGGAAHDVGCSLESAGYGLVARPEGFIVWGTEGPLRGGERQRAQRWGSQVMRSARARQARPQA